MMETRATELSEDRVGSIREKLRADGVCILPDAFDAATVKGLLDRLWLSVEESGRRGWQTYYPEIDPNEANVRVFHLLELDEVFRRLVSAPLVRQAVRAAIGDEFILSNSVANIARPGSRSMMLHSDLSLVIPEPWGQPWSVNVITCLTDTTFENGATLHIPGSHRWQGRADVPDQAEKLLVPIEARAGSLIIMDGRMWHTSGRNITASEDRALILTYYTVPFLRQQINWTSCLSQATVESLEPELKDMLGLEVFANMSLTYELSK